MTREHVALPLARLLVSFDGVAGAAKYLELLLAEAGAQRVHVVKLQLAALAAADGALPLLAL
jgi:hypothetical protein